MAVVGYSIHTDFEKAFSIAGIQDSACRKQLLLKLEENNLPGEQAGKPQKPGEKHTIQISDMVSRWMAEHGAEILN